MVRFYIFADAGSTLDPGPIGHPSVCFPGLYVHQKLLNLRASLARFFSALRAPALRVRYNVLLTPHPH